MEEQNPKQELKLDDPDARRASNISEEHIAKVSYADRTLLILQVSLS